MHSRLFREQAIPLSLTLIVCLLGVGLLFLVASILNLLPFSKEHIFLHFRLADMLVGTTIYLKTSIDFAIFIGRLMHNHPGWKNRIAIEIGTALGNILGTLLIFIVWDIFREVRPLMAIMIFLASLVLLRLAEDGLDHAGNFKSAIGLKDVLGRINHIFAPILDKILPHSNLHEAKNISWSKLFLLSLTVPFLLGADDFAGYLPLFNVVNVLGFATGVFVGHMILNIALFISPQTTIKAVKNELISFFGSIAFTGLAIWGIIETLKLIFGH